MTETFIYDAITWWQHHGASTNSCGPKLRDWPRRQEFVTPQLQPAPNDRGESAGYFNVEMFVQHSKQFVQNLSTVPNLFYQIRRFVFHKLNSRGFGGIYRLVYVWFRWYLRCSCDIFFESFLNYISASNLLFSLNWAGIFTRTWEVNLPFTPNVFRWIAVNLCQNKWRGFQQTKGYFSDKFLCFLTWQNENVQSDILQLRNFKKNKWNRRSIYVTISIFNKACTLWWM